MRHLISAFTLCFFLSFGSAGFAAAEGEDGETKSDAGPIFMEFAPFSVSVIQRAQIAGYLSVAFDLAVEEEAVVQQVERLRPKVRDAVLLILTRVASSRLDVTRPVDVDLIRAYVQKAVNNVLGAGKAQVLMAIVSLQPA